MNLSKLESAIMMAQEIMKMARMNFDRDGYLVQAAFLFGTKVDPHTGEELAKPGFNVVAAPAVQNEADKDAYVQELGRVVRFTRCTGVGILAEAWHADVPLGQEHLVIPGRVHELPGAREVAHFLLEHRELGTRQKVWIAQIHRPASGKPTLGEFKLQKEHSANYGRMSRLLGTQ